MLAFSMLFASIAEQWAHNSGVYAELIRLPLNIFTILLALSN